MTLIIVIMLILGYLFIATGHLTGVNKAAIAMFLGTIGWVVYVIWGADFVMKLHPSEYLDFLAGAEPSSHNVKEFIYDNIFLNYVGHAASIVMFLVATMSIVEILNTNGCFDFIHELVQTRSTRRVLLTLSIATFLLSANLDNLTTTTMMLVIMHGLVANHRQRMLIGTAIVVASNCGGCLTVIGDPTGLILWDDGAVTATRYSSMLILPLLVAWLLPTAYIYMKLPSRLDIEWVAPPYRGDDTRLNRWQRLLMLFVGIGGLWFIPTFHNITNLSPFLGALCVLSVLWVVNEAVNRKLMQADQMTDRQRVPRVLQYGAIQQLLFVMGIMLAMGVMTETGVMGDVASWIYDVLNGNVWLLGIVIGVLSALVDTFTVAITSISFFPIGEGNFAANGIYWLVVAFSSAVGGTMLTIGSASGLALMKMEHVRFSWFLRTLTPVLAAGFVGGLIVLLIETIIIL